MKSLILWIVRHSVHSRIVWNTLYRRIMYLARHIDRERSSPRGSLLQGFDGLVDGMFSDRIVKGGPFRGMTYPELRAVGSSIFPKLIGSYEKELQLVIEELCRTDYSTIVDVGCAEGYYAVGLAMRIPSATVYAYDTNENAIRLCRRMAEVNDVSERVVTGSFCDADTLAGLCSRGRGLIISDCEGYEKELLAERIVPLLSHHDLLVEVHAFLDEGIPSALIERFHGTHEIVVCQSLDDAMKVQLYGVGALSEFSEATRMALLGEHRPNGMHWFYMRARAVR